MVVVGLRRVISYVFTFLKTRFMNSAPVRSASTVLGLAHQLCCAVTMFKAKRYWSFYKE